jgi:hypothetical protein
MKAAETVQVNAQDRFGYTPLWYAIAGMDKQAAERVRDAGGKLPEDGKLAQRMCEHARNNNVAVFELLHALKMDLYVRVRCFTATCCSGLVMLDLLCFHAKRCFEMSIYLHAASTSGLLWKDTSARGSKRWRTAHL